MFSRLWTAIARQGFRVPWSAPARSCLQRIARYGAGGICIKIGSAAVRDCGA